MTKHNAIIVVGVDYEQVLSARNKAIDIFDIGFSDFSETLVSSVVGGVDFSIFSFFVSPDGIGNNLELSDLYNILRDEFLDWLKEYEVMYDYVEVCFGGKRDENFIVYSSN